MELNKENEQLSQKIANFLSAHGKIILYCVIALLLIACVVFFTFYFKDKAQRDAIAGIERIVYELNEFETKEKAELEKKKTEKSEKTDEDSDSSEVKAKSSENEKSSELIAKEDSAIKELQVLAEKRPNGYAGFRANTIIAEIYFGRKSYKEALKFYELAAKADDSHYIAGIACFNVAACADELGDKEKAAKFYEKASQIEEFPLIPRALFNLARMKESMGKKDEAISVYNSLLEKYPRNEWALLGKSRIIELEK